MTAEVHPRESRLLGFGRPPTFGSEFTEAQYRRRVKQAQAQQQHQLVVAPMCMVRVARGTLREGEPIDAEELWPDELYKVVRAGAVLCADDAQLTPSPPEAA